MNNRRSFLKGLLATAAFVATAKVVAASEMLGTTEKVEPPKPPASFKYDPVNYIGEWKWRNLEGQPLGENGFYSARF